MFSCGECVWRVAGELNTKSHTWGSCKQWQLLRDRPLTSTSSESSC